MRSRATVLASALLLAACASGGPASDGTATTSATTGDHAAVEDSGTAPDEGVGEVEVEVEESADADGDCASTADADHPDVVAVDAELVRPRTLQVTATLCSAYDTPDRYADAWRVRTPGGEELGVRELLHDHAGEQPFTRSLSTPVEVPEDVDVVVVEGRDRANGWGGATLEVRLGG